MRSSFCPTFCLQVAISRALASFWRYPYLDVRHDTLRRLVMGGAYPYMDLNAINGKLLLRYLRQSIQIRISPKRANTKSIVKVETGIVTLISYHHYLKIVGKNKLWPHMQKESWNIHGTKTLISSIWMGQIRNPRWEKKRLRHEEQILGNF
jgi:hypothetical protein